MDSAAAATAMFYVRISIGEANVFFVIRHVECRITNVLPMENVSNECILVELNHTSHLLSFCRVYALSFQSYIVFSSFFSLIR